MHKQPSPSSFRSIFFTALFGLLLLGACTNDTLTSRYGGLPSAFGKANKLTVIADSTWWYTGLGDSVDFTFGAPFLILPSPEPLYDLNLFSWKMLAENPARKELRSYLIISHRGIAGSPLDDFMRKDLGDSLLPDGVPYTVKVLRNRWALGQFLVYIYGQDEAAVYEAIQKFGPSIIGKLRDHDLPILDNQTFAARENGTLIKKVKDFTGASFRIPGEYVFALESDSTMWLRKELKEMTLGLLFRKIPYTDQSQFTKEGFRSMHDRMSAVVSSPQPEPTRMMIDDHYLPLFLTNMTVADQYALEVRGLWTMHNDVMGGPFISYLIQSPDKQSLILATGFIYGPGKKKREWVQQLELILRSARF